MDLLELLVLGPSDASVIMAGTAMLPYEPVFERQFPRPGIARRLEEKVANTGRERAGVGVAEAGGAGGVGGVGGAGAASSATTAEDFVNRVSL